MRAPVAEHLLEGVTRPLDLLRQRLLLTLGPLARPFIRSRRLRVTTIAVVGFAVAAALSVWLPLWQLALGPIIWGVPHIVGDLRYLVLRQRLARSLGFWLLIITPLAYFTYRPRVTTAMIALMGAAVLGLIHLRARREDQSKPLGWTRFCAVLFVAVCGYFISRSYPYHSHFVLLHAHNVITLGLWWSWRRRARAWELLPIVTLIALSAVILCAWDAESWRAAHADLDTGPASLTLHYFEITLARIIPEGWRPQWVALYGFLQSAHYLVWIRLIPEDDREAETPIPFRRSAMRLVEDFGGWLILFTVCAMIGLAVYATSSVAAARMSYLRWISAHASLEIAMIGYFAICGSRSGRSRALS